MTFETNWYVFYGAVFGNSCILKFFIIYGNLGSINKIVAENRFNEEKGNTIVYIFF